MKRNQNTLDSKQVILNGKAFFLDLKESKNGKSYLVITQSKPIEDEKYERIKMILFEGEIAKFCNALNSIIENFPPKADTSPSEEYIAKVRQTYPMAFQPWTKENEELLIALFNEGKEIPALASALQRRNGAITARLTKLGLIEKATAA